MNFRAIILVLVIVVFAVSMGAVNFASLGSVDLEQAQTEGTISVIQNSEPEPSPYRDHHQNGTECAGQPGQLC